MPRLHPLRPLRLLRLLRLLHIERCHRARCSHQRLRRLAKHRAAQRVGGLHRMAGGQRLRADGQRRKLVFAAAAVAHPMNQHTQ